MVFGWVKKLKTGLSKSSQKISGGIQKILKSKKIDDKTLTELEELLISSDLGVECSAKIVDELKKAKLVDPNSKKVKEIIKKKLKEILKSLESDIPLSKSLSVMIVVGVNGVGKTATIGKLSEMFFQKKKKGWNGCR
ncbi:MAG: signal recognition particle receptor subunit alpha [Alphaproteobacteria bacterium]